MIRHIRNALGLAAMAVALLLAGPSTAADLKPEAVLAEKCGACHQPNPAGAQNRIADVRKTPEGWAMTIERMMKWHGLPLTAGEERALVKYLADRQGLAPEESAPYRYVLERRPGTAETPDDAELATTCARCHSYARVALQRRDAGDWLKLANMHMGQWPTMEYQAMSRDREYWKLLSTEIPKKLGDKWPLKTAAWSEWSKRQPADLSGRWRVFGHRTGKGSYAGTLTVKRSGPDQYALAYEVSYGDGAKVTGEGASVVYTGYEWRGSVRMGKETMDEVYAVAADNRSMSGRWFMSAQDGIGADVKAVREDQSAILAIEPPYVKAGTSAKVTIIGSQLVGTPDLGPGIAIEKVLSATPGAVTVEIKAAKDAVLGTRPVQVGATKAAGALTVYDKVGSVKVEPEIMVARVGGNGGPLAPEPAQFDAVGYLNGPDGKPGTEDDVRIGPMPAKWVLGNFDKEAEEFKDAKFGGTLDQTGFFMPAKAGINKARGGLFNNFANLSVNATVTDGPAKVKGAARLIVAPQRWVDAPIR